MTQLSINTSRRHFIKGCALTAAGFSITKSSSYFSFEKAEEGIVNEQAQTVIYHDRAHFDKSGLLVPYKPPVSLASSTREYVERVDSETFLSRHWFV